MLGFLIFHRLAPLYELPAHIDFDRITITPNSSKATKNHNIKKMWIYEIYYKALENQLDANNICQEIANTWQKEWGGTEKYYNYRGRGRGGRGGGFRGGRGGEEERFKTTTFVMIIK